MLVRSGHAEQCDRFIQCMVRGTQLLTSTAYLRLVLVAARILDGRLHRASSSLVSGHLPPVDLQVSCAQEVSVEVVFCLSAAHAIWMYEGGVDHVTGRAVIRRVSGCLCVARVDRRITPTLPVCRRYAGVHFLG
jgi:hypothetical protein